MEIAIIKVQVHRTNIQRSEYAVGERKEVRCVSPQRERRMQHRYQCVGCRISRKELVVV